MNQIDNYIYNQKPELRELLIALRSIILKSNTEITEKISYRIPFFYRNKPLCYLNPTPKGVDIGFWSGINFRKNAHLLELKNRKQIKTYFVAFSSKINIKNIKSILKEAIELDDVYENTK